MVDLGGTTWTFAPSDSPIGIGRDPANAVVVTQQSVSSSHATLAYDTDLDEWRLDDHSTYGTFTAAGRVTSGLTIATATELRLGDPVDGPRLEVRPIGSMTPTPTAAVTHPATPSHRTG